MLLSINNFYRSHVINNGIEYQLSAFEQVRLKSLNKWYFICIVISLVMLLYSFLVQYYFLFFFSIIHAILFYLCFWGLRFPNQKVTKTAHLLVTNFSVLLVSFCLGFDSGFYFYFFTAPIFVFIVFDKNTFFEKMAALSSYFFNALLIFTLNKIDKLGPLENIAEFEQGFLFVLNFIGVFFLCVILINFYIETHLVRNNEVADLSKKKILLENKLLKKELEQEKQTFRIEKLIEDYNNLDQFNHIISHNMRGPLTRMTGLINMLKLEDQTPDQKVATGYLEQSVVKMDELIKDLNYILVQKKLGADAFVDIPLKDLFSEVLNSLEDSVVSSKARVLLNLNKAEIKSVKSLLVSVFYNLISNAIKYAKPNEAPVIEVSSLETKEFIEIHIQDNGMGIDLETHKDKVFKLYKRFHETNTIPGRGMGLYLVKSHIDMLKGKIQLFSRPNEGCLFIIQLPKNIVL